MTLLALVPAADAAGIAFRNDLPTPIIIQVASITNNVVRRGRPTLVLPSRVTLERMLPPGKVLVLVYDANQPSRVLFQETILFPAKDLFLSLQLDPPPAPKPVEKAEKAEKAEKPEKGGHTAKPTVSRIRLLPASLTGPPAKVVPTNIPPAPPKPPPR
jgi:hypothetical protein